jgi:hypothetical protein
VGVLWCYTAGQHCLISVAEGGVACVTSELLELVACNSFMRSVFVLGRPVWRVAGRGCLVMVFWF